MKKVIYAILVMILSVPLSGYTVKGGVTYTVETARKETFANVEYTLPKSIIEANKVDPNYQENMKAKSNGIKKLSDRYITYFDDGTYGVTYYSNLEYGYYYSKLGKLEAVDKDVTNTYPIKKYRFNMNGELKMVSIYVAPRDSYVFELNGQLKGHWVNDKCYDLNGKIIGRRY